MAILVIAEHDNATLKTPTLNTVTAAAALGDDIHVLVAGSGSQAAVVRRKSQCIQVMQMIQHMRTNWLKT